MARAAPAMTIDGEPAHVEVPRSAFTLAGFRAWVTSESFPDRVRASFIDREVLVDMSPEAIDTHNDAKTEITAVLRAIVRDEQRGRLHADRVLLTQEAAGISTEPDVVFVSFESIETGRVRFVAKARGTSDDIEICGSPDLVVEVVSDSSVRKDTVLLRAGYARAGVREYWLVASRGPELSFEILVLRGRSYRRSAGGRSVVLDRTFHLERVRDRVGRWSHRLRVVAE